MATTGISVVPEKSTREISFYLLDLDFTHPTRVRPDYELILDHKYRISFNDYHKKIQQKLRTLREACEVHEHVNLHIKFHKFHDFKYRRVYIFLSQFDGEDAIESILLQSEVLKSYTFPPQKLAKLIKMGKDGISIDLKYLDKQYQNKGIEIGPHETSVFLDILESIRSPFDIANAVKQRAKYKPNFIGWYNEIPVNLSSNNILLFGNDTLIPPLLHNSSFENTVIVSRNRLFWMGYEDTGAAIQILSAGDGIEVFKDPENYVSKFSVNLLEICKKNLGFTTRFIRVLLPFLNTTSRDSDELFELVNILSTDPAISKIDLYFKDLFDRDEQDPYWMESDLKSVSHSKGNIENNFGKIIRSPFFQFNRGNYDGITVIDTSLLDEYDHTVIGLFFLTLSQVEEFQLILSDMDQVLDNMYNKSDFDKLMWQIDPRKLIFHFSKYNRHKSWYSKFDYKIINPISIVSNEIKNKLNLDGYHGSKFVLIDSFDDFTLFDATKLKPIPVISEKIKEIIEEDEPNDADEEPQEREEISALDAYIIGGLMSYLASYDNVNEIDLYQDFVNVNWVEDALEIMQKREIISITNTSYQLNYRFKNSIQELKKGMHAEEREGDITIGEYIIDMGVEFTQSDLIRKLQLIQNFAAIAHYLAEEDRQFLASYHLAIGLYREILDKGENSKDLYDTHFFDILSLINIIREDEDLKTDIEDISIEIDDEDLDISEDVQLNVEEVEYQEQKKNDELKEAWENYRREQSEEDVGEFDEEIEIIEEDNSEILENDCDRDAEDNNTGDEVEEDIMEIETQEVYVSDMMQPVNVMGDKQIEKPEMILSQSVQIVKSVEEKPVLKIHPDSLKEQHGLDDSDGRGWIPSDNNYSLLHFYSTIPIDIFVLTFEVLKRRTRAERENKHISPIMIDYVKEQLVVNNSTTITELIQNKMCRMRKRGLVFNNFQNIFLNRLGGKNIGEEEYRKYISEFKEVSRDEIAEFLHSDAWIKYVSEKPKSVRKVQFSHPMIKNFYKMWAISHYDTTFGDLDAILMGIINIPDVDDKYIDVLAIYFKLLVLSQNDTLDEKKLFNGYHISDNLKYQCKRIFNSIKNIEEEVENNKKRLLTIPGVNLTKSQKEFAEKVEKEQEKRKHAAVEQLAEIKKQLENAGKEKEEKVIVKKEQMEGISSLLALIEKLPDHMYKHQLNRDLIESLPKELEKLPEDVKNTLKKQNPVPLVEQIERQSSKQHIPMDQFVGSEKLEIKKVEKQESHPIPEEILEKCKAIKTDVRPIIYLKKVLTLMISEITDINVKIGVNELIEILNRAGTEASVAVNSFTSNIADIKKIYKDGDDDIRNDVMAQFMQRIHSSLDNLRYDDSFVEVLKQLLKK